MKYKNPKAEQEFEFISRLMQQAHGKKEVPSSLVEHIRELYGEPIIREIPENLMDKIERASPEFGGSHYIGGWWAREGSGKVTHIGPEAYFAEVRHIVLSEFYPGKVGYDRVQQYWKKQPK